jgi:hypothetical protein
MPSPAWTGSSSRAGPTVGTIGRRDDDRERATYRWGVSVDVQAAATRLARARRVELVRGVRRRARRRGGLALVELRSSARGRDRRYLDRCDCRLAVRHRLGARACGVRGGGLCRAGHQLAAAFPDLRRGGRDAGVGRQLPAVLRPGLLRRPRSRERVRAAMARALGSFRCGLATARSPRLVALSTAGRGLRPPVWLFPTSSGADRGARGRGRGGGRHWSRAAERLGRQLTFLRGL